jgi:tRNA (guanine-N7-)-methyltransferase
MHPQRRDSFYGRRKGKPMRPRQQALMDILLPALRIDVAAPAPDSLSDLFDRQPDDIRMEIGFGGGEYLTGQAEELPDCGFIGVEPFQSGMAKALSAIDRLGLKNIRLYDQDAGPLLEWLPPECLNRIDLLYPDPWPKRRHWKRRFVSDGNIARFARVLKPGGCFRFASDINAYVAWTLDHMKRRDDFVPLAQSADDIANPWPGWKQTRYEAKALREGRSPAYLTFEKR